MEKTISNPNFSISLINSISSNWVTRHISKARFHCKDLDNLWLLLACCIAPDPHTLSCRWWAHNSWTWPGYIGGLVPEPFVDTTPRPGSRAGSWYLQSGQGIQCLICSYYGSFLLLLFLFWSMPSHLFTNGGPTRSTKLWATCPVVHQAPSSWLPWQGLNPQREYFFCACENKSLVLKNCMNFTEKEFNTHFLNKPHSSLPSWSGSILLIYECDLLTVYIMWPRLQQFFSFITQL